MRTLGVQHASSRLASRADEICVGPMQSDLLTLCDHLASSTHPASFCPGPHASRRLVSRANVTCPSTQHLLKCMSSTAAAWAANGWPSTRSCCSTRSICWGGVACLSLGALLADGCPAGAVGVPARERDRSKETYEANKQMQTQEWAHCSSHRVDPSQKGHQGVESQKSTDFVQSPLPPPSSSSTNHGHAGHQQMPTNFVQ
eukprot:scaffold305758_cov13-Tisochrysis_lutea.AAC.1